MVDGTRLGDAGDDAAQFPQQRSVTAVQGIEGLLAAAQEKPKP